VLSVVVIRNQNVVVSRVSKGRRENCGLIHNKRSGGFDVIMVQATAIEHRTLIGCAVVSAVVGCTVRTLTSLTDWYHVSCAIYSLSQVVIQQNVVVLRTSKDRRENSGLINHKRSGGSDVIIVQDKCGAVH
jgi:hypothetical protein